MQEHDPEWGQTVPVWAAFGDLMSGLVGAFVLLLMGVMAVQLDMASHLQQEIAKKQWWRWNTDSWKTNWLLWSPM